MELLKNTSKAVTYCDPVGMVPTSSSLKVYDKEGKLQQTAVVTLPTATTTVAAGTTSSAIAVADASGFSGVGSLIKIVSDGVDYVAKIARVDGNTFHLSASLPLIPDTGAAVSALEVTATIAAIGTVGTYRIEWNIADATDTRQRNEQAYVVNWLFEDPISSLDVAEILELTYGERRQEVFYDHIRERVNAKIERALAATGRRAHLYASPDLFREAARTCIHWILAESGFAPAGSDISEWIRQMRIQFDQEIAQVINSLETYDKNEDGELSTTERTPAYWTIQTRR